VGKLLLIAYVIFVAVLLLNLLIARMAVWSSSLTFLTCRQDTHAKVDNRAFQEWSLTLVSDMTLLTSFLTPLGEECRQLHAPQRAESLVNAPPATQPSPCLSDSVPLAVV
jgi:hypothetical protein